MIPMKLTSEKVRGTEISCGSSAADGVLARDAKSGAFLRRPQILQRARNKSALRDERSHVADAGHQTRDHRPRELGPMERGRLADDGSDALRLHNAPDEERDARGGRDDGLNREEVAAVDGKRTGPAAGK